VHALKDLLALPLRERPTFLQHANGEADYCVPTAIYNMAMPDELAMRYGRLMNELQSVAANANFIDDARFITNVKATIPAVQPPPIHLPQQTHTRIHVHSHVG
jgi:hypothetical protein